MYQQSFAAAGNVAGSPELKYLNGRAKVEFRLAVHPVYFNRNSGEIVQEPTVFHSCEAWDDDAEHIAASFSNGERIVVIGTQHASEWTDKTTGQTRRRNYINVEEAGLSVKFDGHDVENDEAGE